MLVRLLTSSSRSVRVSVSFCLVLAIFSVYRTLAVPLIEPTVNMHSGAAGTVDMIDRARNVTRTRLAQIAEFFQPGEWEREDPMILDSDRAKLLIKEYHNRGAEGVELVPCTIVFYPKEPASPDADEPRVIILQAQSAVVRFDTPMDLSRAKIGRVVGGRIDGPIKIRGVAAGGTTQDDLLVTTRDLEITEAMISTPHHVDFRMGPHQGHGTELRIGLTSGPAGTPGEFGGVDYLELVRNVQMHIQPGSGGLMPGDRVGPAAQPWGDKAKLPVDVNCGGPFRFNVSQNVATFSDRVTVLRNNPTGEADLMNCELLSIFFAATKQQTGPAQDGATPNSSSRSMAGLEPRRLEAHGNPVVIHAPSTFSEARARRLEYDIPTGKITLEADDNVMLKQGSNRVDARRVEYTPAQEKGRVGALAAEGPGSFSGQFETAQLQASWGSRILIQPAGDIKVLSLLGGGRLDADNMGWLAADDIHVWFSDAPGAAPGNATESAQTKNNPVVPLQMQATGNVNFGSPQLEGKTGELGLWFVNHSQPDLAAPGHSADLVGSGQSSPPTQNRRSQAVPQQADRKFRLNGGLVQARLGLIDRKPSLEAVTVKGAADLREISSADPNVQPMVVRGDELSLNDAHLPTAKIAVLGKPAEVTAAGMKLLGADIQLSQADNRLWSNGPGKMMLTVDRDLSGQQLTEPQLLDVLWQGGMDFDGRTATYRDRVVVQNPQQWLRTGQLNVKLQRRIDFADMSNPENRQVAPEQIDCVGPFEMETRTVDPLSGKLQHIQHLTCSNLLVNQSTGVFQATGPGTARSHRYGTAELVPSPAGGKPPEANSKDQLSYSRIDFQSGITGDIHRKEMTFHRMVQTVHGPVDSWEQTIDVDQLSNLRKGEMSMKCDRLTVGQTLSPQGKKPAVEMTAIGNAEVETDTFAAAASRIAYSDEKKQLVLDSTAEQRGPGFVQFRRNDGVTGSARKVTYYVDTQQFQVDSAGAINLGQLGSDLDFRRK